MNEWVKGQVQKTCKIYFDISGHVIGHWRIRKETYIPILLVYLVLTSRTLGRPSGNQYNNWWFNEKNCFLEAIVFAFQIYSCFFLQEEQIFKSSIRGRPRDQMMGRSRDVRGTLVKHVSQSRFKSRLFGLHVFFAFFSK